MMGTVHGRDFLLGSTLVFPDKWPVASHKVGSTLVFPDKWPVASHKVPTQYRTTHPLNIFAVSPAEMSYCL